MLQRRVIVCLDVRDGRTTKGVRFQDNIDVGDPVEMARHYYDEGADELVFYDITASAEERKIMIDVVRRVAEVIFIPFSVGGGDRGPGRHARSHTGGSGEGQRELSGGPQSRDH